MIPVSVLPTINAFLNGISASLLAAGYLCIRKGRVGAHRAFMVAAFAVSTLFLCSYVYYHVKVGSIPFSGQGWIRPVYFTILISHILLAFLLLPLALTTLFRAFRSEFDRHRKIARWTFPVWMYISLTGVTIYWMLYRM